MSRIALSVVALSLAACNLADAKVTGSGATRTEARTTAAFARIEVKGSITLEVTVGGARSIEVTADDNVVPIIRTTVKKGKLIIDSSDSYSTRHAVLVKITTPTLDALGASGSSTAQVRGVDTASLALAVSGSGSIDATGKAASIAVSVSGSGEVHARGVASAEAAVSVSGSGGAEVSATDALAVQLSGSGTVDYWGKPQVSKAISGSGSVRKH